MSLRIEFAGESIFMNDFWVCECASAAIRRKQEWIQCPKCRAIEDDCPDAELEQVLLADYALTPYERESLILWVCTFAHRSHIEYVDEVLECTDWERGDTIDVRCESIRRVNKDEDDDDNDDDWLGNDDWS